MNKKLSVEKSEMNDQVRASTTERIEVNSQSFDRSGSSVDKRIIKFRNNHLDGK